MKQIFFLLTMLMLTSCATLREPNVFVNTLDYSPLTNSGIFVTESNSVSFNYTPIGSVMVEDIAGYKDGRYYSPNINKAFNNLETEMKRIGANGIINFKITQSTHQYPWSKIVYASLVVTGMAIKMDDQRMEKRLPINYDTFYIDDVPCEIIEVLSNGYRVRTWAKLTVEQLKKAKEIPTLNKKMVRFYLSKAKKNEAYAGIDNNSIILYESNEIIDLE